MAISLQKGQRVSLDNDMKFARVGLGWDTNRYAGGADFDLDASAFMLGTDGRVTCDEDFVFYNQLHGRNDAVVHQGDNLTGEGDGDDEVIIIDFAKIPDNIDKIAITVTIHDEFDETGEQVLRFDLEEEFSIETSLVVCEIYRKNGEWKFNAVAGGVQGGLEALCQTYGVNI